jgi:mono/diheme cytochrome c family protein
VKHVYILLGIAVVGIVIAVAMWPNLSRVREAHENATFTGMLPEAYISPPSDYSWVDKTNGVARIPVDRAMKIVAEKGLPWGAVPDEPEPVVKPSDAPVAAAVGTPALDPAIVQLGQALFTMYRCSGCHVAGSTYPQLNGRYGTKVALEGGGQADFDDAYIRESMLEPKAKTPAGFKDRVMPAYKDRITDDEMNQIIIYIRSLK